MTLVRLRTVEFLGIRTPSGTAYVFPDVSALGLPDHEVAIHLPRQVST